MCCIEPERYFGGCYDRIAKRLEDHAVHPDGLPTKRVPAQPGYTREQLPSGCVLFTLQSATAKVQYRKAIEMIPLD